MPDKYNDTTADEDVYRAIYRVVSASPDVVELTSDGFQAIVTGISSALGKKMHKGIYLKRNKNGIQVIISVALTYGISIPEAAFKLQCEVQNALAENISDPILGVDIVVTKIIK